MSAITLGCGDQEVTPASQAPEGGLASERCPTGQFWFDDRCVAQCPDNDNTICELDGRRIVFSGPSLGGAGGTGGNQPCVGECAPHTATALALGLGHTCALLDDGSVRCFGDDAFGQLGGSALTGAIPNLKATALAAGTAHSCALVSDGTVQCWGRNETGQLGDGTLEDRTEPVSVAGVSGAVQIAAGDTTSYALLETGRVVLWGDTRGHANAGDVSLEPRDLGLDNVKKITPTGSGTCALRTDGTIRCYGWHDGMAGGSDPETSLQLDGVTVTNATDVACIELHVCLALLADGDVISWGFERWGVNGHGQVSESKLPPMRVAALSGIGVTELAGGNNFACARRDTGQVLCWGKNALGQLGYVSEDQAGHYTPTALTDFTDVKRLALGTTALHACVQRADEQFYCWGNDLTGQLGEASKTQPLVIP